MEQANPSLKESVITSIMAGIDILATFPEIAKFCPDERYKHMRELFVSFGKSGHGYLVLYEYKKQIDTVLIATIRHSKESGYKID